MSTKRDPVLAVLKYFDEAPLPLAQQALALAQQTVRRRRGPAATKRVLPSLRRTADGSLQTKSVE